jgi:lipoprotein-releasing system ATP-binding protein
MNIEELRAENVFLRYNSRYDDVIVFEDVNFTIQAGQSCAIIGQSGCGKTSFLHIIGGLLTATRGEIFWGDSSLKQIGTKKEKMRGQLFGFVLQNPTLIESMNVFENILLPWRIAGGFSFSDAMSRADELLDAVGLLQRKNSVTFELSGGERQRVSIARALMLRPSVVIADEPTGNLDEENAHVVAELLFSLCKNQQSMLLLATHNAILAKAAELTYVVSSRKITQVAKTTS